MSFAAPLLLAATQGVEFEHLVSLRQVHVLGKSEVAVSGGLDPYKSGGCKWLRNLVTESGGRFRCRLRHQ